MPFTPRRPQGLSGIGYHRTCSPRSERARENYSASRIMKDILSLLMSSPISAGRAVSMPPCRICQSPVTSQMSSQTCRTASSRHLHLIYRTAATERAHTANPAPLRHQEERQYRVLISYHTRRRVHQEGATGSQRRVHPGINGSNGFDLDHVSIKNCMNHLIFLACIVIKVISQSHSPA